MLLRHHPGRRRSILRKQQLLPSLYRRGETMKRIFPTIRKMTQEETTNHNLHNPGLILEYCNLIIPLSGGYSDNIMIFQNSNSLMILITNRQVGYVGLDQVDCLNGDIIGSVFLEEHQLKKNVSVRWIQMKPETLINRLSEYL